MAIGDKKKPSERPKAREVATPSKKMFEDSVSKTAKVNLYVRDPALLKSMKLAALEDDTSLSLLFEEWGTQWLKSRDRKSSNLFK